MSSPTSASWVAESDVTPQRWPLVVVADTTPVLYLARIGQLDLLGTLYGQIVVPGAVWAELVEVRPDAVGVTAIRGARWIVVDRSVDESARSAELALEIDAGEAAAIALAVSCRADLVLVDDLDARRVAVHHGLHIRGTVGVLMSARTNGYIAMLRPVLDALMSEGFRLDQELYLGALSSVGEGPA